MIVPPQKDEPVDELWRTVVELTTAVNWLETRVKALSDMQVQGVHKGKVECSETNAVLSIYPP